MDNGADVNLQGLGTFVSESALSYASEKTQNMDIVRMLLENGADVNAGSGQALKVATREGNEAIAKLLREYGAEEM